MEHAIVTARSRLNYARGLFVRQELSPLGHLIIRHRMPVPKGSETLWSIVCSWRVANTIRGRSLNDAVHPALTHIRMGTPVVVNAGTVIDWAVLDDDGDIEEGGWTRGLSTAVSHGTR